MNKLKSKIMQMNLKKFFTRFIIIALIFVILGGVITGIAFGTQISEVASYMRSEEAQEQKTNDSMKDEAELSNPYKEHGEWKRSHHHAFFEDMPVTKPSIGAKITLGVYGFVCLALFGIYWITIAVWLCQSAVKTGFNGLLWFLITLIGNLFAVILFLLVRSYTCLKCESCGKWQSRKHKFCSVCGEVMLHTCPDCEAAYEADAQYCSSCGKKRNNKQK